MNLTTNVPMINHHNSWGKLSTFIFIFMLLLAKPCFSIGWEEVTKDNIGKRGIFVNIEVDDLNACNHFKISLPQKLFYKDLGDREFGSASYIKVAEKKRGWQVTSEGTKIGLPYSTDNNYVRINTLCLSNYDLKTAYLSVVYNGPQGTIPMIVLLELGEYK